MDYKKAFKYFGALGASIFTAIMVAVCALFFVTGTNASEETFKLLEPGRVLLLMALSFVMSAGSTVYRFANVSKTARICLHAAIYNSGFFAFLWITVSGYEENIGKRFVLVIVGTLVAAVIYTAVTLIARMLARTFSSTDKRTANKATSAKASAAKTEGKPAKQKKSKKEPYENQFS